MNATPPTAQQSPINSQTAPSERGGPDPARPVSASPGSGETATIGDPKKSVVRVIAFSAGGINNVFQFGMVHAFLVSDAPRPHIVAGTSTGAVVAAMLADVLQAGEHESAATPAASRLAQVARFRALLDQILQLPADFKEASLPDFTEVSARAGLVPLNSPTQQPNEKEDRHKTALARFGLTRLLNGMLSARLRFQELTRIIRLVLELQALREPTLRSKAVTLFLITNWTRFCLWLQIMVPVVRDAPLLVRCLLAPAREWVVRKGSWRHLLERSGMGRLRDAKTILFEPWYLQLGRAILLLLSYPMVALGWFFAPPALGVWLMLNRLARGVPIGKKRNLTLRLSGLLILLGAALFIVWQHRTILRYYTEIAVLFSSLGKQNFLAAFGDWQAFRHGLFRVACFVLTWAAPGVLFAAAAMAAGITSNRGELLAFFLDGFGIKKDLLTTGVLNKLLMRAFDPYYFGKRDFMLALNEALGGRHRKPRPRTNPATASAADPASQPTPEGQRQLGDWIWHQPTNAQLPKAQPILVAPVAADVATGRLVILEPATAKVEALRAACALTPLFEAVKLKITPPTKEEAPECWLVDGSCVAREPIQPVLDLIKQLHLNRLYPQSPADPPRPFANLKLIDDPGLVDLCVISPFPTRRLREQERRQMAADMDDNPPVPSTESKPTTGGSLPGILYRLSEILSLRATHAAKDERILVTLYNAVLRQHHEATRQALFCSASDPEGSKKIENWHLSANLRELEPEKSLQLAANLMRCADESARRTLMLRTVADGCRASFEGLYRNKLHDLIEPPQPPPEPAKAGSMPKSEIEAVPPCRKLCDLLGTERPIQKLPGVLDEPHSPPGITEICRECQYYKDPKRSWAEIKSFKSRPAPHAPPRIPDWGAMVASDTSALNVRAYLPQAAPPKGWPRNQILPTGAAIPNGKERPLVSVVFSGGVFRGVFQVGVLNAFCMAGVRPDVVAGASVGTIMAALSARVFSETDDPKRRRRIAGVAATFLAIDRLVLTDRFADFIRRFSLRAGSADFSLRDADHLFRRFDRRNWELLARRSRRVLAGIARLISIDPLRLLDLLRLRAGGRQAQWADRSLRSFQHALDRAGIGSEILGAEPLDQLIKAHVLAKSEAEGVEFNEFLDRGGIHFMATTTNLTTGELDVLGSFCNPLRQPALVPGLLASSAFPAVFRPRMNWELRAGSPGLPEELIDGGIADNLPIIPVYRFLLYAGHTQWLKLRPAVDSSDSGPTRSAARPHLLLTASLEPRKQILHGETLERTVGCWPALKSRVDRLQYNVKVDSHRRTQFDLRRIQDALREKGAASGQDLAPKFELLDLHVSCVKPEWLCGTFAFHPMLGFTRRRQAQSIAHGCASAWVHLFWEQQKNPAWTAHWWNPFSLRPGVCDGDPEMSPGTSFKLRPKPADAKGNCCFVEGHQCPFSRPELDLAEKLGQPSATLPDSDPLAPLGKETKVALHQIYQQCGKWKTHRTPVE